MNICPSCGGVIGRDCFNPRDCAEISKNYNVDDKVNQITNLIKDMLDCGGHKVYGLSFERLKQRIEDISR